VALCTPFDRALLHDALGRLLRRRGERRQAAEHLRAAYDHFCQLGAVPFRDHSAAELAACGLRPARRRAGAGQAGQVPLTAREQSVVELAARGLTNRQVASELVISVKTAEYHMCAVFSKFGVSTRTQLAARIAEISKD
jgi:DNA-binding NarL/FixJ family response regulator